MASDDDDESFITYGEPLDEEEDDPKLNPTAIENQVVKDAQGRRRFHGAFTGGFSAGYYNSVGSKEGWTPSTFVSSRSSRRERTNQRAEDFMDDEDLGEYGIAPRQIKTSENFQSSKEVPKRPSGDEISAIPGLAPLEDLVRVTNSSIGAQILKKMGWREGQGVGPKIRKYKKMSKAKHDKMDNQQKEIDLTSESERCEEEMRNFLFAPDDVQHFLFQMKSDQKGLGYSGISRDTSVLGGHINLFGSSPPPVKGVKGKRKGIKGSAFGIGAFEEQDEDIYSTDSMEMYDRVLGGDETSEGNFGWTAPKPFDSSHGCIDGFITAAERKTFVKKVFPPPTLPHGYHPVHVFSEVEPPKEDSRYSRFSLSSVQRSAVLGEEVLPGKPSTPESKESKERLPGVNDSKKIRLDSDDKEKGQKTSLQEGDNRSIVEGITEWERQRGRSEFTRAANIHKPVSQMMASRFVTAQYKDEEVVEYGSTNQVDKSQHENAAEMKMYGKLTREIYQWYPHHILCKRFNVPDPHPGSQPFFNGDMAEVQAMLKRSSLVGVPSLQKEKVSVYNFLTNPQMSGSAVYPLAAITAPTPNLTSSESREESNLPPSVKDEEDSKKKKSRWDIKPAILSIIEDRRRNVTEEKVTSDEKGHEVEEEEDRPPKDLFNAIFNETDSSDSESSDSERKTEERESPEKVSDVPSPGRGLTAVNDKEVKNDGIKEEENGTKKAPTGGIDDISKHDSEEDELYGPALPPKSDQRHQTSLGAPPEIGQTLTGEADPGRRHSKHSHSKHKKHHHSSESRNNSRKKKDKKGKRRKEKKHRKESHRERSKDKQKSRRKEDSDSSYSSASEG